MCTYFQRCVTHRSAPIPRKARFEKRPRRCVTYDPCTNLTASEGDSLNKREKQNGRHESKTRNFVFTAFRSMRTRGAAIATYEPLGSREREFRPVRRVRFRLVFADTRQTRASARKARVLLVPREVSFSRECFLVWPGFTVGYSVDELDQFCEEELIHIPEGGWTRRFSRSQDDTFRSKRHSFPAGGEYLPSFLLPLFNARCSIVARDKKRTLVFVKLERDVSRR